MHGGAELVFSREGERTVLRKSCSQLPLQVQRALCGPSGEAIVTLLSPTGDLLEDDDVELEVICEPGADVVLRQASATRLHGCESGAIAFSGHFEVGVDARLRYLPLELIPFAHANYRQHLELELDDGAEAVVWEVIGPGRVWEVDAPRQLGLQLEAWVQGELAFADLLRLNGPNRIATAGHSHVGCLLQFGPSFTQADADHLHEGLTAAGLIGSASLLPSYGVGARVIAGSADQILRVFESLSGRAITVDGPARGGLRGAPEE
ncbi:MAG TPA: urease accessory protein UreD [Chloroflexota bacterium]